MEGNLIGEKKWLKLSFWTFLITIGISPIFFTPFEVVPLFFAKSIILLLGASFSLLFFIFHLFKEKRINWPKNPVLFLFFPIIIVLLFSALLNVHPIFSLVGYGFEVGTFIFIFLFWTVFLLSFFLFQNSVKIFWLYFIFILNFFVLTLYHLLRFFVDSGSLSFGVFMSKTATPLGNWNELAFLAGAVVLICLMFWEFFSSKQKIFKPILILISFLGLFLMAVLNVWPVWILTFFTALFFAVFYIFKFPEDKKPSVSIDSISVVSRIKSIGKVSLFTAFILIISIVFIFSGNVISQNLSNFFEISYLDVKPSWRATGEIFLQTIKSGPKNFLLGSGPNSFIYQWRNWKPDEVNLTPFWNTDFKSGSGLLPTFAITGGLLGLISWILFLAYFFWFGIRQILKNPENRLSVCLFFTALYFWLMAIFYSPSQVLFIFSAVFSGIFIASVYSYPKNSFLKSISVNLSFKEKQGALFILLIVIFLLVNIFATISVVQRSFSATTFQKGINSFAFGDLESAEKNLIKASKIAPNDIYNRHLSALYLVKAQQAIQNTNEPNSKQIEDFRNLILSARDSAELAVIFNRKSFENWVQLGNFYEFLSELDPNNSSENYENAKKSYQSAKVFDQKNPLLDLLIARLEMSLGALDQAEVAVKNALSKKSNYGEAIFLLSRIKALHGDLDEAINSTAEAINLLSQEPSAYFQLGLLYYQKSDYLNAKEALKIALSLEPQYANARYFLGLSSVNLGENNEAIEHFKILNQSHPTSEEVRLILNNLEAGRDPLEVEDEDFFIIPPEEREGLPLDE